jgi:hypothetical protein
VTGAGGLGRSYSWQLTKRPQRSPARCPPSTQQRLARPVRVLPQRSWCKRCCQAPLPLPEKPSLAVLPFQNMTGDAELQNSALEVYFTLGNAPWCSEMWQCASIRPAG